MDALPDLATLSDDDLDRLIRETRGRGGRHLAAAPARSTGASTSCAASVSPGCAARSPPGPSTLTTPAALERPIFEGTGDPPDDREDAPIRRSVVALRRRAARGDPRARARGGRHLPAPARPPRADRHPARRAGAAPPRASRRPEGSRHDPRRPSMSHVYCPECGFQNPEASNYCARCGAYLRRDEHGETTLSLAPEEVGGEEVSAGEPRGPGARRPRRAAGGPARASRPRGRAR